jgi:CBS domain-containing protein
VTIGRICVRSVVTTAPEESVSTAAALMDREGVGTVVVLGEDRRPVGILTDRDIALRCVGRGLDPEVTDVGDVMTSPVETVSEETSIEDAVAGMGRRGLRRMVVVDRQDRLAGIVALDDVLDLLIEEAESVARVLRGQTPGGSGPER